MAATWIIVCLLALATVCALLLLLCLATKVFPSTLRRLDKYFCIDASVSLRRQMTSQAHIFGSSTATSSNASLPFARSDHAPPPPSPPTTTVVFLSNNIAVFANAAVETDAEEDDTTDAPPPPPPPTPRPSVNISIVAPTLSEDTSDKSNTSWR
jgi:hypothetical protein